MAMLDKLKNVIGGRDPQYQYECTNCGTTFESPHVKINKVQCPECHTGNPRMSDRA